MALDDGIIKIYSTENVAPDGSKPDIRLIIKVQHCFEFEVVGLTRFYAALQANNRIESVAKIWGDKTITSLDICVTEDGSQFKIVQVQHFIDDDGLRKTRLSLERLNDDYKYKN